MDTWILAQEAPPTTTTLNGRDARALRLFEERGQEIRQIGTDLFEVPSCTVREAYIVEYGALVESCTCKNFEFNGGPCKHMIATALLFAARRSGVREIRIPTVVAGDPFAYRAKKSCHCYGGYHYIGVEENGEEHTEAVRCTRCSS